MPIPSSSSQALQALFNGVFVRSEERFTVENLRKHQWIWTDSN
jgi:hypothetical protein